VPVAYAPTDSREPHPGYSEHQLLTRAPPRAALALPTRCTHEDAAPSSHQGSFRNTGPGELPAARALIGVWTEDLRNLV
jgi:hypothetical protein